MFGVYYFVGGCQRRDIELAIILDDCSFSPTKLDEAGQIATEFLIGASFCSGNNTNMRVAVIKRSDGTVGYSFSQPQTLEDVKNYMNELRPGVPLFSAVDCPINTPLNTVRNRLEYRDNTKKVMLSVLTVPIKESEKQVIPTIVQSMKVDDGFDAFAYRIASAASNDHELLMTDGGSGRFGNVGNLSQAARADAALSSIFAGRFNICLP